MVDANLQRQLLGDWQQLGCIGQGYKIEAANMVVKVSNRRYFCANVYFTDTISTGYNDFAFVILAPPVVYLCRGCRYKYFATLEKPL